MKTLNAVAAFTALALALPTAALAHTASATVSCSGAEFSYVRFAAGSNTVNYRLTVDNAIVAEGTFILNAAGGHEGHLVVPLTLYDTHRVQAFSWWGPAGVVNGETRPAGSPALADQIVHCPAAPLPAPAPVAQTPPAPAPVAAAPPAPSIVVEAERVSSAPTAHLLVQAGCAARHARVTVAGRLMRQVQFSVAGRHARTVNVAPNKRSVTTLVPLRRHGPAVQVVTTRVRFRNGARTRTLTSTAQRCGQAAVAPVFTG
jgi:hypothetical protein